MRDYLHVIDLAKGHLLALTALADDSKVFDSCPTPARYKAYNLGKGKGMSVLQIVEAMRKATGFDYKYEIIGRRYVRILFDPNSGIPTHRPYSRGDVPDLTADPALAEKELGFHASQDLETMCRDLWNWQTKNPNGYDTELPQPVQPSTTQQVAEELKTQPIPSITSVPAAVTTTA